MTGRAYLGEVLHELSLAEIHQEMSELLDKQVNAQKEKLPGFMHVSSRKPTKKVCDENERKNDARVKIIIKYDST